MEREPGIEAELEYGRHLARLRRRRRVYAPTSHINLRVADLVDGGTKSPTFSFLYGYGALLLFNYGNVCQREENLFYFRDQVLILIKNKLITATESMKAKTQRRTLRTQNLQIEQSDENISH